MMHHPSFRGILSFFSGSSDSLTSHVKRCRCVSIMQEYASSQDGEGGFKVPLTPIGKLVQSCVDAFRNREDEYCLDKIECPYFALHSNGCSILVQLKIFPRTKRGRIKDISIKIFLPWVTFCARFWKPEIQSYFKDSDLEQCTVEISPNLKMSHFSSFGLHGRFK